MPYINENMFFWYILETYINNYVILNPWNINFYRIYKYLKLISWIENRVLSAPFQIRKIDKYTALCSKALNKNVYYTIKQKK